MRRRGMGGLVVAILLTACGGLPAAVVKIERQGAGYRLLRGGEPFYINGAVTGGRDRLESVAQAGGNSIRGGVRDLDAAQAAGLTVLANIGLGLPRGGFDYNDASRVAQQKERIRQSVLAHKDHPAILLWALGNELEISTTPEQRAAYLPAMNDLARMIHEIDPDHPVMIVMGGQFRDYLPDVQKHCPDLDLIGLNAYGMMFALPETLAMHGWQKPYVVTEFGPLGHWESPKTPWGLPREMSSTEKADFYERAYRHAVQGQPACLGSYVFYWSQKQEKTHTWYGMFLPDGRRTAPMDTMQRLWTGSWPANRCPALAGGFDVIHIEGQPDAPGVVAPGATLRCSVVANDPEGDPLTIDWDLRPDVSDNPNVGGDFEPDIKPIDGAVTASQGQTAEIRVPEKPGNYRIFVYAGDPHGNAATANRAIRVEVKR